MKKSELRKIVKEETKKLMNEIRTKVDEPVLIKVIKIDKNKMSYPYKPGRKDVEIESQAMKISDVKEFFPKINKFKKKIKYNSHEDILMIRPVKDRIGSLTKEQQEFLETLAWNTGDHYELFY